MARRGLLAYIRSMVSAPVGRVHREPAPVSPPAIRLRFLLGLALVAWGIYAVWPRGHAAWKLHNLAVVHADYALCMVGPTGPMLLREDPREFRALVRRRIISASPTDRPLHECQKFSEQMGVEHSTYRLHDAEAQDFVEYNNVPGRAGRVTVDDLDLSLTRLDEMASRAWPFVRSGSANLMKPSSHAKEAAYAPAPPRSGLGSGLPAARHRYRSTIAFGDTMVVSLGSGANSRTLISKNGGVDWTAGGSRLTEEVRDHCVADDEGRAFTLSRMTDGRHVVLSQGPSAAPQLATLGGAEEEIAGVSCDESALVAALVQPKDETGNHPVELRVCPFRRPCRDMVPPEMGRSRLYYPLDIARVGGDTIVARTAGGVTRVSSTRDEGRSWLPWTVAYDYIQEAAHHSAPFRLLVVGDSVLLYSGARGSEQYPLLVSEDHGASFAAPELAPNPANADNTIVSSL